jgi:hypothetical protein
MLQFTRRHLTIHSSRTRFAGRLNSGVMLHRQFPSDATQATICAYFWAGIVVGVFPFQRSKDWAYTVVEVLDVPPIEIIEIASANDRNDAMDALQSAAHGADQTTTGYWLLADIFYQIKSGDIAAGEAVRLALRVAQTTGLPNDIYYDIDAFDDELQLAVNGAYSSPDQVAADILNALAEYSGAT